MEDARMTQLGQWLQEMDPSEQPLAADVYRDLVHLFSTHLTPTQRQKILRKLEHETEHFRRASNPGHHWYPMKAKRELFARRLFREI